MDYYALWAAMVINVTSNISNIISELRISQGEFLKCLGYSAKSSFIQKKRGAVSPSAEGLKDELQTILQQKEDELQKNLQSFADYTLNPKEDKDFIKKVKTQEKYAETLIMAIDSYLFFGDYTLETFARIAIYALYNSMLVDDNITVTLSEEVLQMILHYTKGNYNISCDDGCHTESALSQARAGEDSKQIRQYALLCNQPWYRMNFKENRGLSYQFQYFKYCKDHYSDGYKNRSMFKSLLEVSGKTFPVITGLGFISLRPYLKSILSELERFQYGKDILNGEPLKFAMPDSGLYTLYESQVEAASFDNVCRLLDSNTDKGECSDSLNDLFVKNGVTIRPIKGWDDNDESKSSDYGSFSIPSTPIDKEVYCISMYYWDHEEQIENLLLFIDGPDEMHRLSLKMAPEIQQKTVFAYCSTFDSSYICFTYQGKTYNYALKIL